jgi:RNAse (barnase) inhibitor barstar
MKRCVLDGARLPDATAVYRTLAEAFGFPEHFGHNADALWDALGEVGGEPREIVWHHSAVSAKQLGSRFNEIVAVLRKAAAEGLLRLELA